MFGDSFGIILEDCGIFKDSLGILQDFKKKEKRRKDTFSISGVFRDSLGLILRFFEILWNSRASLFQCLCVCVSLKFLRFSTVYFMLSDSSEWFEIESSSKWVLGFWLKVC